MCVFVSSSARRWSWLTGGQAVV